MAFAQGEFSRIAHELLGGQSLDRLAEILEVNPRTVQRWMVDRQPVPPEIEELIRRQAAIVREADPVAAIYNILIGMLNESAWPQVAEIQARKAVTAFTQFAKSVEHELPPARIDKLSSKFDPPE